jgi:hypothetical protein
MKSNCLRKMIAILAALSLVLFCTVPANSHLAGFTKSATGPVPEHWPASFSIPWNLNPKKGSNINGSRNVADIITASFATWQQAPNAAVTVSRGPNDTSVTSSSNSPKSENVICFVCSADFGGDETLAITFTTVVSAAGAPDGHGGVTQFPGQIIKADIFFNPQTTYSTDGTGGGEDLQTVATHEIGHLLGLDHSAVVRAVMFPFAPSVLQTLSYDDVAGISTLYPKAAPDVAPAVISGTIRMANSGTPVFGAHVYASSTTAAEPFAGSNIRKTPIGTLTFPDGSYSIQGLPPDSYNVIVEPLDDPVSASDVPDFDVDVFGKSIQTNFTTRWR